MSNYSGHEGYAQQQGNPQQESLPAQNPSTGREMGLQLNELTGWSFVGSQPNEYGQYPPVQVSIPVGLEANPLAVSKDPDTGIHQELHAVVHIPGSETSPRQYYGLVGVRMQGEYGLMLVCLPSRQDPALIVDANSFLDVQREGRPSRLIGNTLVTYEPSRGVVNVSSRDSNQNTGVAMVDASTRLPRDTSLLGDVWTLPTKELFEAADPEYAQVIRKTQEELADHVREQDLAARKEALNERMQKQFYPDNGVRLLVPVVPEVVVPQEQPQRYEPFYVPEQPLEVPMAETQILEDTLPQPTLRDVYLAQNVQYGDVGGYETYAQQAQGYPETSSSHSYEGYTSRSMQPPAQPAATTRHPYFDREAFDYPDTN